MRKHVLLIILLFIGHQSLGQLNPFEQNTYEYYVSGTIAKDTNSLFFLKNVYNDILFTIDDGDKFVIFIDVPEDDIFFCISNKTAFEGELYELGIFNLIGRKSKTGSDLNQQYEKFYSSIIKESVENPNLTIRGRKNPIHLAQISVISSAFISLIDKADSIQISNCIITKTNLNNELATKIHSRIKVLKANEWTKQYLINWLERLQNLESNENIDESWSKLIKSCDKKILFSPWVDTEMDYIPKYYKDYLKNSQLILLNSPLLVICNFEKYKVIKNKKFKLTQGYKKVSKGFDISIYSSVKRKFATTRINSDTFILTLE